MPLESPRSQYRQLADLLRAGIESGEYPPGSVLPSEPALSGQYDVSRASVNRAVAILRSEGLVRVERGRGSIVRELPVIRRDAAGRQRQDVRESGDARGAFQAELERLGLTARSEVQVSETAAPADVARLLEVEPGAAVLARRREMYANDIPVQLATSYLPLDIAAGTQLAEADTGAGGTYSRLADLGQAPVSFTETVRVRPADEAESRLLRLDAEQRALIIRRTARTAAGRIVEVNDIVLPAHQWELVYDWPAGEPGVRT
jgi:GntR family transcriptional regulator